MSEIKTTNTIFFRHICIELKYTLMKRNFIKSCCYITTILSLFSGSISYGQQLEKHDDSAFVNQHVTGVGTTTIVYHLDHPMSDDSRQACLEYLNNYPRILSASVSSSSVTMEFAEQIVSNEMIYLFIQRLEMNYIRKPKQS